MKAIILAAGKGERMRPISESTPKALLKVNGKPLIEHHIENLKKAGVFEIIVNLHHLGQDIKDYLGDGSKYNIDLVYSVEDKLLNTGGGMYNALDYLGSEPFIYLGTDIFTNYNLVTLTTKTSRLGHLVLVPNPDFNPGGDFDLNVLGEIIISNNNPYTFGCIGVISPKLFTVVTKEVFPLIDVLNLGIAKKEITGEIFTGVWHNIGTPQQLDEANGCDVSFN